MPAYQSPSNSVSLLVGYAHLRREASNRLILRRTVGEGSRPRKTVWTITLLVNGELVQGWRAGYRTPIVARREMTFHFAFSRSPEYAGVEEEGR